MLFSVRGGRHSDFLFKAVAEIILVGISAPAADLLQRQGGIFQVLAGRFYSEGSDGVADTLPIHFFKEGAEISRAYIGMSGNVA